jgi:hypothetical protein
MMGKLTKEQEARKTYLFFKASLTTDERRELEHLLGMPSFTKKKTGLQSDDD